MDEFEDHLNEAKARCDRNRKKFERVSKVLIDVKAGIDHLMDKLEVVQLDGEDSVGTESIVDKLALVCICFLFVLSLSRFCISLLACSLWAHIPVQQLEKKLMAVMKKVSESDQYRSGDISQLAKSMGPLCPFLLPCSLVSPLLCFSLVVVLRRLVHNTVRAGAAGDEHPHQAADRRRGGRNEPGRGHELGG